MDLFESERPSRWLQKISNGHRALLINWSEEAKTMEFDLAKHNLNYTQGINFWNDEKIQIIDNKIIAEIAPRSSLLTILIH